MRRRIHAHRSLLFPLELDAGHRLWFRLGFSYIDARSCHVDVFPLQLGAGELCVDRLV
jgi:hypothetical protein